MLFASTYIDFQVASNRTNVLGSDMLMLPTGNGKSLSYASFPYIFYSLGRSAGERDAYRCTAVVVCLGYLYDNYLLLALAGHNEYIPSAQELSAMLPDGFSVGLFGWSQHYNYGCEIKTTATCHEVMSCPPSPSSV